MSPCLMCAEKNCHNCPCAICEVVNGKLQDNFVMQTAMKNKADCKKFMVRLSVELQQIAITKYISRMQKIQTMQCSRLWKSMITESSKAMRMSLNRRSRNRRMIDWQASGKPVGYQKLRIVG